MAVLGKDVLPRCQYERVLPATFTGEYTIRLTVGSVYYIGVL